MQDTLRLISSYLPPKRLYSAAKIYLDYRLSLLLRRSIVNAHPPALMIEPTNICNLSCPLCPSGSGELKRARGMMDLQLFKDITDQVHKHIGMFILWNQGEPYLNPAFNQMVSYASSKGIYTMTSTNGSLEMNPDEIIDSGLNRIIFSLDGTKAESYEQYRIGGDFELVKRNIAELTRAKRNRASKTPHIVWQFILMSHNEDEIKEAREMAKQLGVDKLEFKTVQIYDKEDIAFLPSKHQFSRYKHSKDKFELKTKLLNRCRRLWTQPVINWDGELAICCYDKDLLFPIGNIRDHSFLSLWKSAKMNKIRRTILRSRKDIEICRNCGEGIVQKIKLRT
ncbi:MAG TPA: radical SAM protein [Candidatus Cloacimonetes bacterium]|nr:radical SAM protein [Candidatus Cloacimonadota bacterium]